jgi:hypothetical protein
MRRMLEPKAFFWSLYTSSMESLKIIAMCLLAGALYGVVHDQITARVCVEYFTVYHPDVFHTHSPTLLALGWGVLATWWVSFFLGVLLAIAARLGSSPKVAMADLIPKVLWLLVIMALCSLGAGISGYFLQAFGMEYYAVGIPKQIRHDFYADLWAHNASYLTGFVGGMVLCVTVWRGRVRANTSLATGSRHPKDQPVQRA